MHISGSQAEITHQLLDRAPDAGVALAKARKLVPHGKQEVYPYQAIALYLLAKQYDGKPMLEIGTYHGFTAAVMALAAPESEITTLNPTDWEVEGARTYLRGLPKISVRLEYSWDWLEKSDDNYDFIFIDGDHKNIAKDLPWWERLNPGGLMLFHDYTPFGAPRHCPPVFEAVNEFAAELGRKIDVTIIDNDLVGMAGFYKDR